MGHSEKCIAPLLLGGIIAAGASLAGNAIGAASQNNINDTSKEIAEINNQFNAEQAQLQLIGRKRCGIRIMSIILLRL